MLLPNMSDDKVLAIINRVAKRLGPKFRFGYHSNEDMVQQAIIFALEGLKKYDNRRSLETFLWAHVHHQLYNFKRDHFQRPDTPCDKCDKGSLNNQGRCSIYGNVHNCDIYMRWYRRNSAKRNLMNPITLAGVDDDNENNMSLPDLSFDSQREIFNVVDKHMPMDLFIDYTRLKQGVKISSNRRTKVLNKIREILEEHGYFND